MKRFIDELWYVIFDGTSHYGLLGCDVEDELSQDPDIEVVGGPYFSDEANLEIDRLNAEAYEYEV